MKIWVFGRGPTSLSVCAWQYETIYYLIHYITFEISVTSDIFFPTSIFNFGLFLIKCVSCKFPLKYGFINLRWMFEANYY